MIFTTPSGSQLAVLQPVLAGVDEERGTPIRHKAPHPDSKLPEPAAHSSKPGGPCNQPDGPQGRGPTMPVSTGNIEVTPTPAKKLILYTTRNIVYRPPPLTEKEKRKRAARIEKKQSESVTIVISYTYFYFMPRFINNTKTKKRNFPTRNYVKM